MDETYYIKMNMTQSLGYIIPPRFYFEVREYDSPIHDLDYLTGPKIKVSSFQKCLLIWKT